MRIEQLKATLNLEVPTIKTTSAKDGSLKGTKVKEASTPSETSNYEALKKDSSKGGVSGYSMRELKVVNDNFKKAFSKETELLKAWFDFKTPILQSGTDFVTPGEFRELVELANSPRGDVPKFAQLSEAQKIAVTMYELDADFYRTLNQQLRDEGSTRAGWEFFEAHLKDAINILGNESSMVTYRGVRAASDLAQLHRGDQYHNNEFLSSAKNVDVTTRYVHSDTYLNNDIEKDKLEAMDTSDDNLLVMVNGHKSTIRSEDDVSEELVAPNQDWNVELNVRHPHPGTGRDVNWIVLGDANKEGGHQERLLDALDLAKK
jgi:hypothetical protein